MRSALVRPGSISSSTIRSTDFGVGFDKLQDPGAGVHAVARGTLRYRSATRRRLIGRAARRDAAVRRRGQAPLRTAPRRHAQEFGTGSPN